MDDLSHERWIVEASGEVTTEAGDVLACLGDPASPP